MAITNATVIPIIWSARLLRFLQDNTVYTGRTNRTWQNELAANGDRVRLNIGTNVSTIGDYVPGTTNITYPSVDAGTGTDLVLSNQKYWAVKVEDLHAVQSSPNLLDDAVMRAGNDLRVEVDNDVREAMVNGSTSAGAAITVSHKVLFESDPNSADTRAALNQAFPFSKWHRLLDNAKSPRAGRWVILGPYGAEAFMSYVKEFNSRYEQGQAVATNGFLGSYQGFNLYVSNDMNSGYVASTGSSDTDGATASEVVMIGTDYSCAFIDQINSVESMRLEGSFATAVRGLYNYGALVIEGSTMFKQTQNIQFIP